MSASAASPNSEEAPQGIAASRDVPWIATADYARVLHVGPGFEALWGCPPPGPHAEGLPAPLPLVHPDDRARVEAAFAEARRTGGALDVEYRILRPDGALRHVRDRAHLVAGLAGEPPRVFGLSEDVTEARAWRDRLEATRRELARLERLSTLGSLVSGLAHEIRTPLAVASNHLEVVNLRLLRASSTAPLPAELEDAPGHVAATLDALDRIHALVNRLRRHALPDESSMARHRLDEAVAEAVHIFEAAHRGHVALDARLLPTERTLMNKVRMEEVVLRLLENAAEASAAGGSVVVATRETPLAIEVMVKDHGSGLTAEAQAHMFEEFFTTKEGHAGLGLAIARRIVEAHGGAITCRSEPGKGATFVVSLPRR